MSDESSEDSAGVTLQWEDGGDSPIAPRPPAKDNIGVSLTTAAALLVVFALVVVALVVAGRRTTSDIDEDPTPVPEAAESTAPDTTTTLPSAPGTRAFAAFDGPVLGVDVGASVVSTDFDGRLFALDLDTGILTRSQIRTGNFVTVAGRLAVQNGCGGWEVIDVPRFTVSAELIGCSSFLPIDQVGAEALVFAETEPSPNQDLLFDDGDGGLVRIQLGDHPASSVVTVAGGRVLLEQPGGELVWLDPETNTIESYANGRLLAAGPGAVLWTDSCDPEGTCVVWFGRPDNPKIHLFAVDSFDVDLPTRINPDGSRAVFFKTQGVLRIVSTETGHAREVKNPGVSATGSTWSPDGLWLLETSGGNIVALNTLNGRSVEFEGVPGDLSPGWIALPVTG